MRRSEDSAEDPELRAELDAIDATLAGLAVDPRHAELAELTLLLAAERAQPADAFARELDARAARRFAPLAPDAARARTRSRPRRRRRRVRLDAVLAAALAGAAAAVILADGALSGGGDRPAVPGSQAPATFNAGAAQHGAPAAPGVGVTGREIRSVQLRLSARGIRVGALAREIADVVAREHGAVERSIVTRAPFRAEATIRASTHERASFTLRVPTARLAQTVTRISRLRYATVSSRTVRTRDVGGRRASRRPAPQPPFSTISVLVSGER